MLKRREGFVMIIRLLSTMVFWLLFMQTLAELKKIKWQKSKGNAICVSVFYFFSPRFLTREIPLTCILSCCFPKSSVRNGKP